MSNAISPEELLARVARQDVAALGELYDLFAPRVYGLIARIHPDPESAEGILEEVYLHLWRQAQALHREGGSVGAWLVVNARSVALDRLRSLPVDTIPTHSNEPLPRIAKARENVRSKLKAVAERPPRQKSKTTSAHPAVEPAGAASAQFPLAWLPLPKDIAVIDDRLPLLHKAIHQLPDSQQQALNLAVFRGRSEAEIAAEMGEPLGKAQQSLRAAVTFIKHRRRAVSGTWTANI